MKVYQLQIDGKNRAKYNFKTKDEALQHQERLLRYIKDRIAEGQLGFRQYLREAKNLEVVEVYIEVHTKFYSVVELDFRCQGIVKTFTDEQRALNFLSRMKENSKRHYGIMESTVNANESKDYTRQRGNSRAS